MTTATLTTVGGRTADAGARIDFLPFHVPCIGDEEIDAVVATLRSGWLTSGPMVTRFERAFAEMTGARHALAVNSATAALHLALEAAGVGRGDEVIVPTMTFAATAEVVIHLGAIPVLVDSDPATLNLSPAGVEAAVTARTKAIVPVHFAGQPCDMNALFDIAARHRLVVVEDAAHALPARYRTRMVGSMSPMTCFSFYATKTITTGEGGMVTTDHDGYAERIRCMSLHGISRDAWKRYSASGSWYYEILQAGYKYNLTDIAAALGIEQLKKRDLFWRARQRIAALYDAAFQDLPEVEPLRAGPEVEHSWHLYVIRLALERLRITRSEFIEALRARGIGASVHFIPLHLHPFYRETFGYGPEDCPVATAAYDRILSLPIYPGLADESVWRIAGAVRDIARANRRG
jgi:perosamine synthetase